MGNAPIQIGLKCHKTTYQHGESMTGTVYVSVTSVNSSIQSFQGIRLAFSGHENTEVRIRETHGSGNDRTTNIRTERESTSLLHFEVPLTTFASPLQVSKYEFPFEWKLPDTPLPSSFRHTSGGGADGGNGMAEVRYTLTAFLVPREQHESAGFFGLHLHRDNNNNATSACQTIQFVGAPTRSIPEPLHLAEERTTINGLCCCWKQGHVSLGWEADSIVLTPLSLCHLQIWGCNASTICVNNLRVQLIQTIHWQAGAAGNAASERKSDSTTLVDYKVDISHLPQWKPIDQKGTHGEYNSIINNQQQQHGVRPVATFFQVPPDVMDSYQGLNCKVEHVLMVSATTRFMATTPSVPHQVHLQRVGCIMASPSAMPVATAWMEEPEYHDLVLPYDWAADVTVPVIYLTDITALEDETGGGNATKVTLATAQAVSVVEPTVSSSSSNVLATAPDSDYNDNEEDEDPLAFARPAPGSAPSAPTEDQLITNQQGWNTTTTTMPGTYYSKSGY